MSKPKSKEDVYLREKLERLDGPIPDSCKKQIREAKRKLKRQASKTRRLAEQRETEEKLSDDV